MPARRGRYKQLMTINSLGGSAPKTSYANFLQERDKGGWSDDGEDLRYRPPPPTVRSTTSEPKRREKTAVDITVGTQRSLQEGEKMRKTIEDHMWLHRQEERDLRRAEMDIKKNQRQVEKAMKKYEHDLEKQQKSETDWLLGQQAQLLQQQQQDQHERERVTKERTGVHQMQRSTLNEHGKEFVKKGGALAFQYRQLTDLLDQKRGEVDRMSKEYEAKLRAREAEQHKIKQELAGLAISLNMEAQKRRRAEFELHRERDKSTAKDIQADLMRGVARQKEVGTYQQNASKYEDRMAGLTQDFKVKQTDAATKGKRHGRSLASVQTQMEATRTNQKLSRMAQEEMEAEQKGREAMERMERIEAQRQARQSTLHRQVKERNTAQLRTWEQNTATKLTEQQRLKHHERVKQLQKLVTHLDSQEHSIYAQVKEAEVTRRKQETVVDKLQGDLDALKRENAKRLKAAAVEARKAELEVEQKITRETAELTKALNLREEGMRELAIHRRRAKEDKMMLNEETKGHDRKARIIQQRDVTVS